MEPRGETQMHPDFHQLRIDERQRELDEQVRNGFARRQVAEGILLSGRFEEPKKE